MGFAKVEIYIYIYNFERVIFYEKNTFFFFRKSTKDFQSKLTILL